MPFGKYRGRPIAELPRPYLQWVLDNVADLYPDTREAIVGALRGPQGELAGGSAPARRSLPRRHRARQEPDSEGCEHICGRCGLRDDRPLVHVACAGEDEVPF